MDADGLVPVEHSPPFRRGEVIRITAGALADQVGRFECATDEDRVVLLLDLIGRQVRIKPPLETVAPYA